MSMKCQAWNDKITLTQIEAATVVLYFGIVDTPSMKDVASSLSVKTYRVRCVLMKLRAYEHWRQWRDETLVRHGRAIVIQGTYGPMYFPTDETLSYEQESSKAGEFYVPGDA
jgi:hypothetical protein